MKRARFMPAGMLAIAADSWGVEFDCVSQPREPFEALGDFAVVTISGPLTQHMSWAWDSYEAIEARVDAALASHLPALLLKISSPGGQVAGCFELVDAIRTKAAERGKRVLAYVDGAALSAAYALACSAEKIFVPPTGLVGSIGTMQVAVDMTGMDRAMGLGFEVFASGARKADGNPHVAMSDEARRALQGSVDEMATTFFAAVSGARGLTPDAVAALEAAIFVGAKGVAAGLADGVKTLADVVAGGMQITAQTTGAEEDMDEEEKAKAALKAIAEGDDEKAAARAKKALAAFEESDGDDDADEKKDDKEAKAEQDESDEKKDTDAKAEDESDTQAKAAATGNPVMALAAKVQSLEAWKRGREEADERSQLMASRPDLAPEVVAFLERSPLSVVRDAVKTLPRGAAAAKGQVAAARAAIDVQATVGENAGDPPGLQGRDAEELDRLMGIAPQTAKSEPYHAMGALVLPTVRPSIFRQRKAADTAGSNAGKAGK